MDKYIKAQDLIDRIYPVDPENDGSDGCTVVYKSLTLSSPEIEAIVEELPAANVAPVVHGRWEESENIDDGFWVCSVCKFVSEASSAPNMYKYCPNCGAKMDGGQHEID